MMHVIIPALSNIPINLCCLNLLIRCSLFKLVSELQPKDISNFDLGHPVVFKRQSLKKLTSSFFASLFVNN